MYSNLTKAQSFPLAIRVSSQTTSSKLFHPTKPSQTHQLILASSSYGFAHIGNGEIQLLKPIKISGISCGVRFRNELQCWPCKRVSRSLWRPYSQKVYEGSNSNGVRAGKALPWLASNRAKETTTNSDRSSWEESAKRLDKVGGSSRISSWEESAKRLDKVGGSSRISSWEKSAKRLDNVDGSSRISSWEESAKRLDKVGGSSRISSWEESPKRLGKVGGSRSSTRKESAKRLEKRGSNSRSSWEESAEKLKEVTSLELSTKTFLEENGVSAAMGSKESRNGVVDVVENWQSGFNERDERAEEEEVEEGDDPRWDKIKNRFRGVVGVKSGMEKPEYRKWDKQENWGRKTWKEATESNIPKMVGEGIYGVGPVLAALSAKTREFYVLYVQEGLDLSSNNRKKKDKKGFEKVLMTAEKIGLSVKEVPKHDLNMVVDNRPHQGLVLDASPLEMVKIKELDPVTDEDEKSLWVALDEVTDPQNLGAIIRSAYFFGASGVVLCAKNSAPLSGVVSKASAGSLELMELRYCKNMMQFLASSAENGWRVLGGSVSSKAIPLNEVLPNAPTILVLGSEGTGLRPLVERSCTQLIRIPGNIPVDVVAGGVDKEKMEVSYGDSGEDFRSFMAVESLNVSVAAGVLLHHLIGNNNSNDCHASDTLTDALESGSVALH